MEKFVKSRICADKTTVSCRPSIYYEQTGANDVAVSLGNEFRRVIGKVFGIWRKSNEKEV